MASPASRDWLSWPPSAPMPCQATPPTTRVPTAPASPNASNACFKFKVKGTQSPRSCKLCVNFNGEHAHGRHPHPTPLHADGAQASTFALANRMAPPHHRRVDRH
ncbi:MAG: hypothetical protein C0445_12505 [Polaromonas sp.]|nr:hypothetical protein [Polaromonas sp.]